MLLYLYRLYSKIFANLRLKSSQFETDSPTQVDTSMPPSYPTAAIFNYIMSWYYSKPTNILLKSRSLPAYEHLDDFFPPTIYIPCISLTPGPLIPAPRRVHLEKLDDLWQQIFKEKSLSRARHGLKGPLCSTAGRVDGTVLDVSFMARSMFTCTRFTCTPNPRPYPQRLPASSLRGEIVVRWDARTTIK